MVNENVARSPLHSFVPLFVRTRQVPTWKDIVNEQKRNESLANCFTVFCRHLN